MKKTFSEAIKLKDGKLHNLSFHQARIDKTQAEFGGERILLSEALFTIPQYALNGLFKCRVVYGSHIEQVTYLPYLFRQIKKVSVVIDNEIDYSFKYTDRQKLDTLLEKSGCDDIIIIKQGFVTDTFSSNLVFESEEGLFTPDKYLLQGTKRQFLLDTKKISERRITVDDIGLYNRIHFINAMVNLEDNIYIDVSELTYLTE